MKLVLGTFLLCCVLGSVVTGREKISCSCTTEFAPVCGNDGETYTNKGCAACEGVEPACSGQCPCNNIACTCPAVVDPVCGEDDVTYNNACLAQCEGVEVQCKGKCPCKRPCICPAVFAPVCGVDGETYGNQCQASCKGVKVKCQGSCPCKPPCVCPEILAPVCGADGNTYDNACLAKCAKVKVACQGNCPCKPGCPCPRILAPVCGVDGKTYNNKCLAKCDGVPVDCKGNCPCKCDAGIVNCFVDPCSVAKCKKFPSAKCYSNFCDGCNAIFVFNGRIVKECSTTAPGGSDPIPPPRPSCTKRGEKCTAFPDKVKSIIQCCRGLTCCQKCHKSHQGAIKVSSLFGTCQRGPCPKC